MEPTVASVRDRVEATLGEMRKVIVGQDLIVELLLAAVFVKGHVLLEGVPGTAKTLMVRTLAHVLDIRFRRVQFTPDLMPSDIVGTNVFNIRDSAFELRPGPLFTDLLLGDEINRAPAKTQSAMLEAMEERHATIDGTTHLVSPIFTVVATQNPIEYEGTYHLPEAQLDRFHLKLDVPYPSADEEDRILALHDAGFDSGDLERAGVQKVLSADDILIARRAVASVRCEDDVRGYVCRLVRASREAAAVMVGAGPRAGIHMLGAAKAVAAFRGREFITPDDIKAVARPVMAHRLVLQPDAEVEGVKAAEVIANLLDSIPVPR